MRLDGKIGEKITSRSTANGFAFLTYLAGGFDLLNVRGGQRNFACCITHIDRDFADFSSGCFGLFEERLDVGSDGDHWTSERNPGHEVTIIGNTTQSYLIVEKKYE